MNIGRVMQIMDASYRTRLTIERSLHEIDRRALNAMVLVKRHGNKLAGYGVIAQSFRERAAHLEEAASPLRNSIAPLVRAHLCILQHRRHTEMLRRAAAGIASNRDMRAALRRSEEDRERTIAKEEAQALAILRQLVVAVTRLQEGIAEQEYVVTNGRIEAALAERCGAPLMRVSHEMGVAVATVRDAVREYRSDLEEALHENSSSL
jgi:hypothetical protein